MSKGNLKKIVYRRRVRAGFIGIILVIILAKPDLPSLLGGLVVCSSGLFLRTWAAGHLRKEKELTVSGPYIHTRNPLYLGNLIIGFSVVIASRSLWILGIFTAYFLLFYTIAVQVEMERMKEFFPLEYETYKKKTPLFFPSWKSFSSSKKNKFSWELYLKNKEWRAFLGAIFFWLILAGKAVFF